MIAALSDRDRRALLAGAALVSMTLIIGKGAPRWREWEQSRVVAALEARTRRVAAEQAALSVAEVRDSAGGRERRLNLSRATMITAATPEAAAALLASIVEALAADAHVDVGSVALRPDSTLRAGTVRVGVRLSAEGDVKGLMTLLLNAESHETPMSVTELSISQPDASAPPTRVETL